MLLVSKDFLPLLVCTSVNICYSSWYTKRENLWKCIFIEIFFFIFCLSLSYNTDIFRHRSALCRKSCCPWSSVLHFDVYLKCDTLGVIKLSSAASCKFAYNSSSSYQVLNFAQCVICLEMHSQRTEHLPLPTLLSSWRSSLSSVIFYFFSTSTLPLPPPAFSPPGCECQFVRWREEIGVISSPLQRSRHPSSAHSLWASVFVCVGECCCVVCIFTVCMCSWALTQPEKCCSSLLNWVDSILKCWRVDYYSIQLYQICTIPKLYYPLLCSQLIYPFKWTVISHILKHRAWRCTIRGCLLGIGGFLSLGILI